jgi:hypothetical protein
MDAKFKSKKKKTKKKKEKKEKKDALRYVGGVQ